LHACSKEEIKICAILSRGLIGDDYDEFRAGHACKLLNGLPQPDFVYGKYIFQYDSHYFHDGDPAVERDMRVNQRHIQAGYSVIRLRDRLPPLPTCDGLTCVAMNAADRHLTSVYAWARLAPTPDNVRKVDDWAARRLGELVDVTSSMFRMETGGLLTTRSWGR